MNEYDEPELLAVPVRGGDLTVAKWGGGEVVVIAEHGVTGSHRDWVDVAEQLAGDVTLLAPDLRGRGGSSTLPGPYSMETHADDLVATLDHFGIDRAVVAGHSMGAWAAATTADLHPARVTGLLMVDGAIPLPLDLPPGLSVEDTVQAILGPSLDRLRMTFPSRAAYNDYWRAHPGLAPYWNERIEARVQYDLAGADPEWRSVVSLEAVIGDSTSQLTDEKTGTAYERSSCPTVWLWAERGMFDQTPGLYPREVVNEYAQRLPHVEVHGVDDVNHWTILLSERGAGIVAGHVRRLAGLE